MHYKPITKDEPRVTLALARQHGLTDEEYDKMVKSLGRIPTYTELGIYSVMWSEHCSYKNSIALLKTLPRTGQRLLVSAGEENAGLVDIGDGLAVAFKIESHNHPSAVEPYQGAATGVGGILRDIFSMGARPIAVLNSLRFGELTDKKVQYLFKNVVKGIADYGNSFGVPDVAGEIYFDRCYQGNPLVNAMAVGIVEHGKVALASSKGIGNSVMIVGSSTGRDGIHGATFASEEISEKSEAKRPAVQVGDPFVEKLLLEATLEAISSGFVVGVQDMGAAGITCSTTEMSAKGGSGMRIDLDLVPLRESGMTGYEIMLSESQERMLFVVEKGREREVAKIFEKWDLHAVVIGTVTDGKSVEIMVGDSSVANVPANALVLGGEAPVYIREARKPEYLSKTGTFDCHSLAVPHDFNRTLLRLLGSPSIGSKRWVFEQYDSMVRTNTVMDASGDAGVVRIKGTQKALAVKTDCNSRYVYLNPRRGAQIAVAEAARNVVCVGAKPIAITNCLNFGNPYDPEIYWQFREAVGGITDACVALGTPVTGGNVSFYNEDPSGAVFPTPVIGMLGLIEDQTTIIGGKFSSAGDVVILLGNSKAEIGGSEYLFQETGQFVGDAPEIDLTAERKLQSCVLDLIRARLLISAHDISEGGIGVALSECTFGANGKIGVSIDKSVLTGSRPDFDLFGEHQSRIIVSARAKDVPEILSTARAYSVSAAAIGSVTDKATIEIGDKINIGRDEAEGVYDDSIAALLG
jgi:phosphoribosylformylglycinamidine synthase subunit PurL